MSKTEEFLTDSQEQTIVQAIREAEKNTSGEIRVHLEATSKTPPMQRAIEVFRRLKMHQTKQRNGVLIYLSVVDRNFVIYGDKGIHDQVPDDFWEVIRDAVQHYFKTGDFVTGLVHAVNKIGLALQKFFPHQVDDLNELPDAISKN